VSEDDRLAICKIGCDDRHGNSKILEAARFENPFDQVAKPVIAGEAQAGNPPTGDVAKANCAAGSNDARERRATGISRAENAANARARDARNGNVILLEDLKNPKMSESAGKSTA